jgi:hypothetical protein
MNELLGNDILVEDSTCVVMYNSPDHFKVAVLQLPVSNARPCYLQEAAAVSALSGKMIYATVSFCARGAT